jgi:hypothetical protein
MMARRIAYSLVSVFGVLLAVGSALGAGMMTLYKRAKGAAALPVRYRRVAQHNERDLSF